MRAAALVILMGSVGTAAAQDVVDTNVVASGPTPLLLRWSCWHGATCQFANCRINAVVKPRFGRLKTVVENVWIPEGNGKCSDKKTRGITVTYVPQARGTNDFVEMTVKADNGHDAIHRYNITVP